MGTITIPHTFVDDVVTVADDINENFSDFIAEFNGNIEDANIKTGAKISGTKLLSKSIQAGKLDSPFITDAKLDYTLHKLLRSVGVGNLLAFGIKDYTYAVDGATGTSKADVTITFSPPPSDAAQGDPSFDAAPRIVFGNFFTPAGTAIPSIKIKSISSTVATVELRVTGASTASGNLFWMAIAVST